MWCSARALIRRAVSMVSAWPIRVAAACLAAAAIVPTPAPAQTEFEDGSAGGEAAADLRRVYALVPPLQIGPIEGLTTAWHAAPAESYVPVGSVIRLRQEARPSDRVRWEGAVEVLRDAECSIALGVMHEAGMHVMAVEVSAAGGAGSRRHECRLEAVPWPAEAIVVSLARVGVNELKLAEDSSNGDTMSWYFRDESAAALRDLGGGRYRTSVDRVIRGEVEVFPAGFAPLIEWRLDGKAIDRLGPGGAVRFADPGRFVVSAGPPSGAPSFEVETYSVRIVSPPAASIIPEGEWVTFTAVTDPPGFEHEITWFSSTKFGVAAPVRGAGPSFTARFSESFAYEPENGVRQWMGVRADNAFRGQDQTLCAAGAAARAAYALRVCDEFAGRILAGETASDGGRRTLAMFRDETLPALCEILLCKLAMMNAEEADPFVNVGLDASVAALNAALASMSDAQLHALVYAGTDLAVWASAMQTAAPALAQRIAADTTPTGGLIFGSWIEKAIWNLIVTGAESIPIIGDIIKQLIGQAHSTAHGLAISTPTPAQPAADALAAAAAYASTILANQANPAGGRAVLTFVRDTTLPQYASLTGAALAMMGATEMQPYVAVGLSESQIALNAALGSMSDAQLNALVFVQSDVVVWATALMQAHPALAARLAADTGPGGMLFTGSWIKGFIWDLLANGVESLPVIGDILKQILGSAHGVAHGLSVDSATPAAAAQAALAAANSAASTLLAQMGSPAGGRQVLLHFRDQTLPTYASLLQMKLTMMDASEVLPFVQIGLAAAIQRINIQTTTMTDPQLNNLIYVQSDLAQWAAAHSQAAPGLLARLAADTDGGGLLIFGSWIESAVWDILNKGLGSIPEVGDILKQLFGGPHGVVHG